MDMETCAACIRIKAGENGTSTHGMLQFVGRRRNTFIGKRDSAVEEYLCHDCGSWWEHKNCGDGASAGWRFVRKMSHVANYSS